MTAVRWSTLADDLDAYVSRDETAPVEHWAFLLRLAHWQHMWADLHNRRN